MVTLMQKLADPNNLNKVWQAGSTRASINFVNPLNYQSRAQFQKLVFPNTQDNQLGHQSDDESLVAERIQSRPKSSITEAINKVFKKQKTGVKKLSDENLSMFSKQRSTKATPITSNISPKNLETEEIVPSKTKIIRGIDMAR